MMRRPGPRNTHTQRHRDRARVVIENPDMGASSRVC
jgi:hypothetical protein